MGESVTGRDPRFYRLFDGTAWPVPSERLSEVAMKMKYGRPTDNEKQIAAMVLEAFTKLVHLPFSEREKVISELKQGPGIETKGGMK
jgi:hypothetical protein